MPKDATDDQPSTQEAAFQISGGRAQPLPSKKKSAVENPRRIIISGVVIIFLFFGVLGVWASVGTITGAVICPGTVKVENERKTVQHLEGGIVERILVHEGSQVQAGDPVIILASEQTDASLEMLRKKLYRALARAARFKAQKLLQDTITWPQELEEGQGVPESKMILSSERKIFETKREALENQISMLKAQIEQVRAQIKGFNEQIRAESSIIEATQEEFAAKRELYENRYLEKSTILELQRLLATHKGNKSRAEQEMAAAREREVELSLKIADIKNQYIENASENLAETENSIIELQERIRPLQDASKRLTVAAPVGGIVVGLQVHSEDGVIQAGETLMEIVPENNRLIVETQVQVNDIADIYVGQPAKVQLDAFDRRTTPHIPAEVIHISADRMEESTSYGMNAYYIVQLKVNEESVSDSEVYLSPGMPATVFITTDDKTVMDYLLDPLIKNFELALRE